MPLWAPVTFAPSILAFLGGFHLALGWGEGQSLGMGPGSGIERPGQEQVLGTGGSFKSTVLARLLALVLVRKCVCAVRVVPHPECAYVTW